LSPDDMEIDDESYKRCSGGAKVRIRASIMDGEITAADAAPGSSTVQGLRQSIGTLEEAVHEGRRAGLGVKGGRGAVSREAELEAESRELRPHREATVECGSVEEERRQRPGLRGLEVIAPRRGEPVSRFCTIIGIRADLSPASGPGIEAAGGRSRMARGTGPVRERVEAGAGRGEEVRRGLAGPGATGRSTPLLVDGIRHDLHGGGGGEAAASPGDCSDRWNYRASGASWPGRKAAFADRPSRPKRDVADGFQRVRDDTGGILALAGVTDYSPSIRIVPSVPRCPRGCGRAGTCRTWRVFSCG